MGEMYDVVSPEKARKILHSASEGKTLPHETVGLSDGVGRVMAEPVIAPGNLPGFCRSTMDGYAVKASDTFGASEGMPAYLRLIGEVRMGQPPAFSLMPGECAQVWTGGMLPPGSDGVVMLEYTQEIAGDLVEIVRGIAPGENTVGEDEDVRAGEVIFDTGHLLRSQDLGALAGMGVTKIQVFRKPRVGIISTGDEIVEPTEQPLPGQIRDINTYTLFAGLKACGCEPLVYGLAKDIADSLAHKVETAVKEVDCLLISGGSSVGVRDVTLRVLDSLGEPGVLFHGVSVRPGKPTIFAMLDNVPVFGLPGHPVSAYMIFDFFITPFLNRLAGNKKPRRRAVVQAKLTRNIPSVAGREDYVRVSLQKHREELIAEPVFGKSALISTLVKADGVICIPEGVEGVLAGQFVNVHLYRE